MDTDVSTTEECYLLTHQPRQKGFPGPGQSLPKTALLRGSLSAEQVLWQLGRGEIEKREFSSVTLLCSWNYRRLCVHLGMSEGHRSSPPRGLIIHFRESSRVQSGRSQSAVLRPTLCVHVSLGKLGWGGQRHLVSLCRERSGQSLHVVAWRRVMQVSEKLLSTATS